LIQQTNVSQPEIKTQYNMFCQKQFNILKNDFELILEELSSGIKHVHQELEKPLLTNKISTFEHQFSTFKKKKEKMEKIKYKTVDIQNWDFKKKN